MNKYGSRATDLDGYHFDSQAEANRFAELKLLERAGEITCLQVHPVYALLYPYVKDGRRVSGINYEGDFYYLEKGQVVVEDVKGCETDVFKLKRKLFEAKYPLIELRIIQA